MGRISLLAAAKLPSNPDPREMANGILYVLHGSIPWCMIPHDSPLWGMVCGTFATGVTTWPGGAPKRRSAPGFGRLKDGQPRPVPPLPIASRSRSGQNGDPKLRRRPKGRRTQASHRIRAPWCWFWPWRCILPMSQTRDSTKMLGRSPRLWAIWSDGSYAGRLV